MPGQSHQPEYGQDSGVVKAEHRKGQVLAEHHGKRTPPEDAKEFDGKPGKFEPISRLIPAKAIDHQPSSIIPEWGSGRSGMTPKWRHFSFFRRQNILIYLNVIFNES